ncbi:NAD(P)-binding protein [Glonium stellatum]|uniref:NAD(P)-binding protein n=1 Tax=Glonium stellatum TaxID=574774 RepID=A0A8E2F5W9_9PEZI|nr:NAD(P)-binding protein [Glonium stellatum]
MLVLTSATGKLGSAVLKALLENNLIAPNELVISTSSNASDSRWGAVRAKGVSIRYGSYDDSASLEKAFEGCKRLFLVSTPRISMDFNNAKPGEGREKHHMLAINAARKAGIQHIYYTSLAFGSNSKAAVMRAHLRTEEYLASLNDIGYTVIREGLYNESWPLYFGHYSVSDDQRKEVIVAGDGKISWTAIKDLGLGTALILAAPSKDYASRTLYLSSLSSKTLTELAQIISGIKGEGVKLKIVPQEEYENYYIGEREMGEGNVKWWSSTYAALEDGECKIHDGTLEQLLQAKGHHLQPLEATVRKMLGR